MKRNIFGSWLRGAVIGTVVATATLTAQAIEFIQTVIATAKDGVSYWPTAINNSGQVVGYAYLYADPYNQGRSYTDAYRAFRTDANGQNLTLLGSLNGGWSRATDINDSSQIVGTTQMANNGTAAFFVDANSTSMRNLGSLSQNPQENTTAESINASGQVTGSSAGTAYITAPNGGALRDTGMVGSGYGINSSGQVVGHGSQYGASPGLPGGFITEANGFQGREYRPRTAAESNSVVLPRGINDQGQVAGGWSPFVGGQTSSFIGSTQGSLNFFRTEASGAPNLGGYGQYGPSRSSSGEQINQNGQVLGWVSYNNFPLATGGYVTGPNGQGMWAEFGRDTSSRPTAMNDVGQFTLVKDGSAYLISPVPEPAHWAMMIIGLAAVGLRARGHRA